MPELTPELDSTDGEKKKKLWLNDVQSKVGIFGWRLLLSKLPTCATIANRGVITNSHELSCAFCFGEVEEVQHVLFNCRFSQQVWMKICRWMQVDNFVFENTWSQFNLFGKLVKGTKGHKVRELIWLATTWSLD
jgi:hypothetical protein